MLIALFILAICSCVSMQTMDGDLEGTSLVAYVSVLLLLYLTPTILIYYSSPRPKVASHLIRTLTILLIWMSVASLLSSYSNLRGTIFQILRILLPLVTLKLAFSYTQKNGVDKTIHLASIGMMLLIVIQYFAIYRVTIWESGGHLITAYYPLFILPLVLMNRSKAIRVGAILLVTLVIFTSLKRGGVIALAASLVAYICSYFYIKGQGSKSLFYAMFSILVIAGVFSYLSLGEYSEIIERMMNIRDDEGSGRLTVWETSLGMILSSDTMPFLFGHGFNAVLRDSPLELSAHNDLLEAWYDFGLVGLIAYLSFLWVTMRYTKRLLREKSSVAPHMAMTLTFMLILTMISHVLIYFFMTLICLTIGTIAGKHEYDEHNQPDHI